MDFKDLNHLFIIMLSATAVFSVNAAISFGTLFAETLGLKSSSLVFSQKNGSATRTKFTNMPTVLYVRRERSDRHHVANVFDETGNKIYTIERRTMFTPVWSLLTASGRREVGTLHAGIMSRYFDLHEKPNIRHRELPFAFGPAAYSRQFHADGGAGFVWDSESMFLEQIANPGCGEEEIRTRVAKVRQLRTMRFDYELLIDEMLVDREVALVTAYISMLTQWGIGSIVDTSGPTMVDSRMVAVSNGLHRSEVHAVKLICDTTDISIFSQEEEEEEEEEPSEVMMMATRSRPMLLQEGQSMAQEGEHMYEHDFEAPVSTMSSN